MSNNEVTCPRCSGHFSTYDACYFCGNTGVVDAEAARRLWCDEACRQVAAELAWAKHKANLADPDYAEHMGETLADIQGGYCMAGVTAGGYPVTRSRVEHDFVEQESYSAAKALYDRALLFDRQDTARLHYALTHDGPTGFVATLDRLEALRSEDTGR